MCEGTGHFEHPHGLHSLGIARAAISDRKLLRELGFLNYKRPVTDEDAAPDAGAT